jgi:hypothetical protein
MLAFESEVLLMAVTVSSNPSDCELLVAARPASGVPSIEGNGMFLTASPIRLTGFATLLGNPGDSGAGWKVGFIQAQWVETNWCSYRGAVASDGSIFIQRGKAPSRSKQACRDCVDHSPMANVFYNIGPNEGGVALGAAGRFPMVLRVRHQDQPRDRCPLTLQNTLTGKTNFLHEAQFEFLFCTLLSVQDPAGNFQHLMGVYWNVRWQYTFTQPGYRATVKPLGTGAVVGAPFRAGQIDHRFASVLTSPAETQSCNMIFRAATSAFNPGSPNRHESRVWTDFTVTAP